MAKEQNPVPLHVPVRAASLLIVIIVSVDGTIDSIYYRASMDSGFGASIGSNHAHVTRCEFTSHVCIALKYQKRKIYDIAHQEMVRFRSTMVSIAS